VATIKCKILRFILQELEVDLTFNLIKIRDQDPAK
jgi:hypothetical protein